MELSLFPWPRALVFCNGYVRVVSFDSSLRAEKVHFLFHIYPHPPQPPPPFFNLKATFYFAKRHSAYKNHRLFVQPLPRVFFKPSNHTVLLIQAKISMK